MTKELIAQQECQTALDAYGFLVVACITRADALELDREGFIDEPVRQRGLPDLHLRARVTGSATFDEWKRQNDLWGETEIGGYSAFRKVVLE